MKGLEEAAPTEKGDMVLKNAMPAIEYVIALRTSSEGLDKKVRIFNSGRQPILSLSNWSQEE